MQLTTEVSGIHFIPFAETKVLWACIRDLTDTFNMILTFFFFSSPSFSLVALVYWLKLPLVCFVWQGVGPSIAISFSVYETLRSLWQSNRWILHFGCGVMFAVSCFVQFGCTTILIFSFGIRPDDSPVMVLWACGSLSGIASSTGEWSRTSFFFFINIFMDKFWS